jgi:hypothetical protein
VVGAQPGRLDDLQVPEPWCGQIDRALLLFVSSNPGISDTEDYPTWESTDAVLEDFFTHRFGGGQAEWIREGKFRRERDGSYTQARPFWSKTRARAEEILDRPARPGIDYALTEVVHCKSRNAIGFESATRECSLRYFRRVLQVSSAVVIVVYGNKAAHVVKDQLGINDSGSMVGPRMIEGRRRILMFLGHPASNRPQTMNQCLSAPQVNLVKSFLAAVEPT